MTISQLTPAAPSAPRVPEGVEVPGVTLGAPTAPLRACGTCPCCTTRNRPRETWTFRARETHWGHTFLVWELKANPRGDHWIGKRYVEWVR